jgi:rhodanese-related sulfurtransferase
MPKKSYRRERASRNSFSKFMRNPLVGIGAVILLALIVFLIASLSGGSSQTGAARSEISVQQAYQKYQQGVFLLDVRRQDEWDAYHVVNTTRILLDELPDRLNELPRDKEIVIICHSGNRSGQALDILLKAGFTQVSSMKGGLIAWNQAGYPLEGPSRP